MMSYKNKIILFCILYFINCESLAFRKVNNQAINNIVEENNKIIEQIDNYKKLNDIKKEIIDNSEINIFNEKSELIKKQLQKNNDLIKKLYIKNLEKDKIIKKQKNEIEKLKKEKTTFFDKIKIFFYGFLCGFLSAFALLIILKFYGILIKFLP